MPQYRIKIVYERSDGTKRFFDDKDEIILFIREDFKFLKERVNVRTKGNVENTDKVYSRIVPEKQMDHIKKINDDREKWIACRLKSGIQYSVFRYQYKECKRDIYIIIDKSIKRPYFFFN